MIAVLIGIAVLSAHYGYAVFAGDSRQSHIDVYYASTGLETAFVYALLATLIARFRRSKTRLAALLMCAWGFVESAMKGGCQTLALLRDAYPEVDPAKGVCSAITGLDVAMVTSTIFLLLLTWAIYRER